MGTDVNPKRRVSKFASDSSSSWSAKIDSSSMSGFTNQLNELSFPTHFGKKRKPVCVKKPNFGQNYSTGADAKYNSDLSEDFSKVKGFDICLSESKRSAAVPSWNSLMSGSNASKYARRPDIFLPKSYIGRDEQVDIVRRCRTLGVGPEGFYQPVDKDGAKIDVQMMCLGLNWNPERLTYEFIRSVDGCDVPLIPYEFVKMAANSLEFLKEEMYAEPYKDILPPFFINTCIVRFYSAAAGRLGLHQDCSERRESLSKGLPVVFIHLGDSAEFLFGDERDMNKAEDLLLESGDVVIFGGESRHIYYGVGSIIPNSAPEFLVEETRLRPGCLNLTFNGA